MLATEDRHTEYLPWGCGCRRAPPRRPQGALWAQPALAGPCSHPGTSWAPGASASLRKRCPNRKWGGGGMGTRASQLTHQARHRGASLAHRPSLCGGAAHRDAAPEQAVLGRGQGGQFSHEKIPQGRATVSVPKPGRAEWPPRSRKTRAGPPLPGDGTARSSSAAVTESHGPRSLTGAVWLVKKTVAKPCFRGTGGCDTDK